MNLVFNETVLLNPFLYTSCSPILLMMSFPSIIFSYPILFCWKIFENWFFLDYHSVIEFEMKEMNFTSKNSIQFLKIPFPKPFKKISNKCSIDNYMILLILIIWLGCLITVIIPPKNSTFSISLQTEDFFSPPLTHHTKNTKN